MEQKKIKTPMPVGIVFLIIGLVLAIALVSTIYRLNGDHIIQIDGTIVDYESNTYKGNTQYHAIYEYELNNETHTYRDIDNARDTSGVGRTVTLYYNTETNRVEDAPDILYFIMGSLAFAGIGIAIIVYSVKLKKQREG